MPSEFKNCLKDISAPSLAAGVATDHAAALLPPALALDFVGGGAVLGHAMGHAPRPLWPLKSSQSANPAALAITFTLRAICDSDNPKTFSPLVTPGGRMASRALHGGGCDGHHGASSLHVGLGADHGGGLPSSQRCTARSTPPPRNAATPRRTGLGSAPRQVV